VQSSSEIENVQILISYFRKVGLMPTLKFKSDK